MFILTDLLRGNEHVAGNKDYNDKRMHKRGLQSKDGGNLLLIIMDD